MDLRAYFSLRGRIARARFALFYGLPLLVLGALPGLLLPHGAAQVSLESAVFLLFLPGICRRLHDINISILPFFLTEAVYFCVLAIQTTGVFGSWRSVIILLANIPLFVLLLALFFVPGTRGPNRFGGDPTNSA